MMKFRDLADMSYAENLWIFFILLLGIIIVPGMDTLFVLANALTGGRRPGFAAIAGIMAGR
jgi:threonine/homoserine/homoserine lactone efflux protein